MWILVLFQFNFGTGTAQETFLLKYKIDDPVSRIDSISFEDSLLRDTYAKEILVGLIADGYLTAYAERPIFSENTMYLMFHPGKVHEWVDLEIGNLEDWIVLKSGFNYFRFGGKPFRYQEVEKLFKSVLEVTQNNGFPFAAIRLDSVKYKNQGISAQIAVEMGPYITFDTLKVTGDSKTNPLFLAKRLDMAPGAPFSQKKIDQSVDALRNIPYIVLEDAPELSFQNEEATFYLPITDRKMNTLDGIIGLLPNEIEENKWLITGQFDLALHNVSGRGRSYGINWQRLTQYSQNLRISALEPMLLGSAIDLKASFYLLKEDTTFLNRDFRLDLGYQLGPHTYLSFFGRRQAGDLLGVSGYDQLDVLPEAADFRYNNYGVDFLFNKLDDVFLPKAGWQTKMVAGLGNKRLLQNTGLPQSLYDGLEMTSFQYYLQGHFSYYLAWEQKFSSLFKLSFGEMKNPNLLSNDLFRLGGLKTIRGFNENYFFANRFFYINLEPRFYFDNYSYFLIFADMGMIENEVFGFARDWPFSFGAGFTLETGSGIFNFIYAVGKSSTQPLGFNYSRIHFGYTGRF